ncbi:MAG: HD domain-containing protein [bacterium]|nr:HD domain-containing protein [bacterium]
MSAVTSLENQFESLTLEKERLIQRIGQSDNVDLDQVLAALDFGQQAHEGQFRKNGEPYFVHPIRVAIRATEYDLDTNTVIGALLHDVIEDTSFTQSNIRKLFGPLVARLVEALTKVKTSKSLTLYKIFQLGNLDFRVILIKLLDRLDNLTDIEALPRHKQRRICQESLAIYAEVAHGLGLIEIEEQMRNLIFKNLYTKRFVRVQRKLEQLELDRSEAIERITATVRAAIEPSLVVNLLAVKLTPQSFYFTSDEVDRLLDHVVIETQSPLCCYKVLGHLHTHLRSIPLSIRDFISNPRANGWRGLSTKVMVHGEQVSLQIVTPEFQQKNRKGLITLMKEGIYQSENYRQFFQLYLDVTGDDNVRIDDVFRSSKERVIQCVTPGGDVIELRYGATILDFAFAVHSELGLKTIGGIINNTRYPRNKVLEDGMVIKVLTSNAVTADESWIEQVMMPKSRREIIKFTDKQKPEKA